MRALALIVLLIIPGSIFILAGYYFYNKNNEGSFKDNIISIVYLLKSELEQINNSLQSETLTDADKELLLKRKDKLAQDLNEFYGERIYS